MSRKIWHCIGICCMAAIYGAAGSKVSWILLILVSSIIVPLDLLRRTRPELNKLVLKIFGPLMREHESSALSGMSYLYMGCAYLLLLNHPPITMLTLFFLAFGDPVASYFGIRYGKDRIIGHKTLQGTMAAFGVCTLIAAIFYYSNNIMTERLLIVAPLSGLIGAVAELLPIGKLDDNLTFPVVGASLLWVLFYVFGA